MSKRNIIIAAIIGGVFSFSLALAAPTSTYVQNLFITQQASTGSPCLVIGANGFVSTSTCGSGGGLSSTTPWTVGNLAVVSSSGALATIPSSTYALASTTISSQWKTTSTGIFYNSGNVMVNSTTLDDTLALVGNGASNNFEVYSSSSVSQFVVTPAGNVGIGTSAPVSTIDFNNGITNGGDGGSVMNNGYYSSPFISIGETQNILSVPAVFTNSLWVKTNGTTVTSTQMSPIDDASAYKLSGGTASTSSISEVETTNTSTGNWTFSVWMKASSTPTTVGLRIDTNNASGTQLSVPISMSWRRYAVTQNIPGAYGTSTSYIIQGTSTIYVWNADLNQGTSPMPYGTGALAHQTIFTGSGNVAISQFGTITGVNGLTATGAISGGTLSVTNTSTLSGNVGVGTSYPSSTLHVVGTARVSATTTLDQLATSALVATDANHNLVTATNTLPTIATTTKSIYDAAPSSTDDYVMFYTESAFTLKQVDCINDNVAGNTATFNITWGSNRNSTTSNAFTSNTACTATSSIQTPSITGSSTVPAGSIIRLVLSAASSTGTYFDFKY